MSYVVINSTKNIKNSTSKFYISAILGLLLTLVQVIIHDISNLQISTKYYGTIISLLIIFIIFYRMQFFVNDKNYLEELVEQYSASLLISSQIVKKTKNESIKKIADNIIKNKTKEIEMMNEIIDQIKPVPKNNNENKESTSSSTLTSGNNEIKKNENENDSSKSKSSSEIISESTENVKINYSINEKLKEIIN
jgi:hypothetical protein